MKVPAKAVGKTATCVKCGKKIKISAESGPTSESSAASNSSGEPISSPDDFVVKLLLEKKMIKKPQLAEARIVQQDLGRNLWEILIDIGHISEKDFLALMSAQGEFPSIDLQNYNVPKDVVQFVPADVAKNAVAFPVDKLGKLLTLVMACPLSQSVIDEVAARTGLKVKVMLSRLGQVRRHIRENYPSNRAENLFADGFSKELVREFEEAIEQHEVAARVFNVDFLPVFKATAQQLSSVDKSGTSLAGISRIVGADPTAALRLLRLSNSAAYGMSKRVDNVPLSVTLMGGDAVRRVLTTDVVRDSPDQDTAAELKRIRERSRYCSQVAGAIADLIGSDRGNPSRSAGLLFELGRIAFLHLVPHGYAKLTRGKSGKDLLETERRLYQFDNIEAGYMIARKWNLPPGITEPLRYRQNPEAAEKATEVVKIVSLASQITEAHFQGSKDPINEAGPLIESLNLDNEKVMTLLEETSAALAAS